MTELIKNIPSSVRVGFYTFEIEVMEKELADAHGVYGQANFMTNTIQLSKDLNDEQLLSTFLHEVLHVIHWVYGLDDKSTEEEFTDRTANGLCALWRDNPEVFDWFYGIETEKATSEVVKK